MAKKKIAVRNCVLWNCRSQVHLDDNSSNDIFNPFGIASFQASKSVASAGIFTDRALALAQFTMCHCVCIACANAKKSFVKCI